MSGMEPHRALAVRLHAAAELVRRNDKGAVDVVCSDVDRLTGRHADARKVLLACVAAWADGREESLARALEEWEACEGCEPCALAALEGRPRCELHRKTEPSACGVEVEAGVALATVEGVR